MLRNRVPHGATERLEPDAGKLARPVLRGGIAGNSDPLPDAKQWKTVAEAIQNPNDRLIVEGFAAFDPGLEGMAVFATNTTTKLLQQQKRQPT